MTTRALMRGGRERGAPAYSDLALGVLWELWRWRLELALLAVAVVLERAAASAIGNAAAVGGIAAGALLLVSVGRTRRLLGDALYRARLGRGWGRAAFDAGVGDAPWAVPSMRSATRVAAGDRLRVRVPRGHSVAEIESRCEELAACFRAREVRVLREPADAAEASVIVVRRDPFEGVSALPWPLLEAEKLSLWDPAPLGVDEQGDLTWVLLPERNVLIGGEPGAGKSAALSVVVAMAALDPSARLWLLDGKLVELAAWAPACRRLAGTGGQEAIALLREVRGEMDRRYRELLARGLRKIGREEGLPLDVVVCDELAFYLSLPDKRERQEFAELLRDLVARGRAAGVIVCAATQKPGSDVVPTALRDLFGFRLALRCNTPQASDTILGQGWASAGADASKIPGGQRGVGYLLTEGDRPVRVKAFYLGDDDVRAIAERAGMRRAEAWFAESVADHSPKESSGGA